MEQRWLAQGHPAYNPQKPIHITNVPLFIFSVFSACEVHFRIEHKISRSREGLRNGPCSCGLTLSKMRSRDMPENVVQGAASPASTACAREIMMHRHACGAQGRLIDARTRRALQSSAETVRGVGAYLASHTHGAVHAWLGGERDGDGLNGGVDRAAPMVFAIPCMDQLELRVVELDLEASHVGVVHVPAERATVTSAQRSSRRTAGQVVWFRVRRDCTNLWRQL